MVKKDQETSNLFINRELSWLEFNDRVLQEGRSSELPPAERLKFLSIVSSNLDEFFMIRVAGLWQQKIARVRKRDASGLTPSQQLFLVNATVRKMMTQQTEAIADVFDQLAEHGFHLVRATDWEPLQRQFLGRFFTAEILPILTPMTVKELNPPPLLPGLQLFVALQVKAVKGAEQLVVIPVPAALSRFVTIPSDKGTYVAPIEDIIADNAKALFGACEIRAHSVFRITRDADVSVDDDEAADLLATLQDALASRIRRRAVRLEISAEPDLQIIQWLAESLELPREHIYEIDGMLDARALMRITDMPPVRNLGVPDWAPETPADLINTEDLWQALQDRDVLLFHPYESFEPVVQLVAQAAEDPHVLAIKQTLYRPSSDSPIVHSLEQAAQNGKEVTVLVELKARFDEAKNIQWAKRLEDAGCHVIYGIAGFKTHAKVLLVIRREETRIRRYVHLSTGNYNEKTARLYADLGLMTCDDELALDVAMFFNLLTGLSEVVEWRQLVIAPTDLRTRFVELIERETRMSTPDRPGLIMAKVNALEDKGICSALYKASQAGVKIMLNVRGICCLRPGVKGVSETISVRSIVDRYLEHARIYYFANGGHEEIYLASADWMKRNLDRRLEMLFPIKDPTVHKRLVGILNTYFQDNVKAWELLPDGKYVRVSRKGKAVRAQEKFYQDTAAVVRSAERAEYRFRPLTRPKSEQTTR
jgi:polyphosphate kinase